MTSTGARTGRAPVVVALPLRGIERNRVRFGQQFIVDHDNAPVAARLRRLRP